MHCPTSIAQLPALTWLVGNCGLLYVTGGVAQDGVEQRGLAYIGPADHRDLRHWAEVGHLAPLSRRHDVLNLSRSLVEGIWARINDFFTCLSFGLSPAPDSVLGAAHHRLHTRQLLLVLGGNGFARPPLGRVPEPKVVEVIQYLSVGLDLHEGLANTVDCGCGPTAAKQPSVHRQFGRGRSYRPMRVMQKKVDSKLKVLRDSSHLSACRDPRWFLRRTVSWNLCGR
mmetsp:Transcript_33499/g.62501  ORF Transcript_33499/g.62501 Transcript_33499/m.62501 type:complete len:226 (-) Transcript_33499:201-878(-)